jgi:hypothetical protein
MFLVTGSNDNRESNLPTHQLPPSLVAPPCFNRLRDLTKKIPQQATIPMRSVIFISYLVFVAQSVFESLQHEDLMRVRHQGNALGHDASVVPCMNGKDIEGILNGSSMGGVLNRGAIDKKPNAPGGRSLTLTLEWKASGLLSTTADQYTSDLFDDEGVDKLFGGNSLLLDYICSFGMPKVPSKRQNDETELAFIALLTIGAHIKHLALHMYHCMELRGGELALFEGSGESLSPRLLSACELEQVEWDSGALSTRYSQEDVYADLSNGEIELSREELILGDRVGREQLLYGLKDGHNFKTVKASDLPSTGDVYDETFVDLRNIDGDLSGDRLALFDDGDCRSAVRIILVYEGKHRGEVLVRHE